MIPARGPQTGVGLPNGVAPNWGGPTERAPKEEIWSSEIPNFRICRQNRRKTNSPRGFLKNPSVEGVAGEHTQLSSKEFPLSSTRVGFLPGIAYFLVDFMCRFRTRSRMFAFGWLASTWEWLERTLDALGL